LFIEKPVKNGDCHLLKINIHVDFELRSFFYEKTPPKAFELKISIRADFKLREFATQTPSKA